MFLHNMNGGEVPQIALVSYDSGIEGLATSESVKDKIRGFKELGYQVTLVTSAASSLESGEDLRVIKIRSLSKSDRLYESSQSGKSSTFLPFFFGILGHLFDFSFRALAGSRSDGRWSWAITALPKLIPLLASNNFKHILATGGPSAAHLATAVACKLTRNQPILEFQDPFIPTMATMSPRAEKWLLRIEAWLLKNCKKFVQVTDEAAIKVLERHQSHVGKIASNLLGSPKLVEPANAEWSSISKPVVFTHLGTLYDSRNFSNIELALRRILDSNLVKSDEILFENIGEDYSGTNDIYNLDYFCNKSAVTRIEALRVAATSDFLLVVQHTDDRSLDTIPFKTFDYLNLAKPIVGLVRNPELKKIIEDHEGLVADPRDVSEIQEVIMKALERHKNRVIRAPNSRIVFHRQLEILMDDA